MQNRIFGASQSSFFALMATKSGASRMPDSKTSVPDPVFTRPSYHTDPYQEISAAACAGGLEFCQRYPYSYLCNYYGLTHNVSNAECSTNCWCRAGTTLSMTSHLGMTSSMVDAQTVVDSASARPSQDPRHDNSKPVCAPDMAHCLDYPYSYQCTLYGLSFNNSNTGCSICCQCPAELPPLMRPYLFAISSMPDSQSTALDPAITQPSQDSLLEEPKDQDTYQPYCTWGHGFCLSGPYFYRCDANGRLYCTFFSATCSYSCVCQVGAMVSMPSHLGTFGASSMPEQSTVLDPAFAQPSQDSLLDEPEDQDSCEPVCTWGHGWCLVGPYHYRCDANGRIYYSVRHSSCSNSCWCGCTSSLSMQSQLEHVGKLEL
ncbi:hypothetical protein B0J13DRAFT_643040 [Dactylonectria estremocensis]|uniref:Uncharacterized protein n=1 Tax=Dactylonectria estremocensis TaxID=1079267 RepID=A0A9P9JFN6_9HYPO|nr:hypothetical protein B0J13DRAFT_643040 [Dactylonectria estremocensis]